MGQYIFGLSLIIQISMLSSKIWVKDLFECDFVEEAYATILEKRKLLLILGVALGRYILPQTLYLREIYFGCTGIWVLWECLYTIFYHLKLLVKVFPVIAYGRMSKAEPRKSLMHPWCAFVSIFLSSSHFIVLFIFFLFMSSSLSLFFFFP